MNCKEAIKELYKEREYLLGDKVNNKSETWHNDIVHYDNINHCLLTIDKDLDRLAELEKENELLKKDLEILEILKKYRHSYSKNKLLIALYYMKHDELKKINDWLKNG